MGLDSNIYKGKNINIGVLGGTFNPIHLGHIYMAREASEKLGLNRVIFMVNAVPPHKKLAYCTASHHRLNMVKLALKDEDKFFIDEYETHRKTRSYTYKTIDYISQMTDKSNTIFLIIGADSLMQLDSWKHFERLFERCSFAVIPRDNYDDKSCIEKITALNNKYDAKIYYLETEQMSISSTDIRDAHDDIKRSMLCDDVYDYIIENNLYARKVST